jgi:4-hydroxybenzoate polyprenyltransferase
MKLSTAIRISRPRFWIYLLGPFFVGLSSSGILQSIPATISIVDTSVVIASLAPLVILAAYFTFPANLLIYGVNDIFDYQTDILNQKKSSYETLVKPDDRRALWFAIALANLPFLIPIGVAAILWPWSAAPMTAFILLGIFYSAPPVRAKARPYLDSVFNILYLFPGLYGFLIFNDPNGIDWYLVIAAAFWCMAMHAYSAVPDIMADQGANLRTIATSLGRNRTLWLCLILYATAATLSIHALGWLGYILGAIYVGFMAISLRSKTDSELFRYYTWFPTINTLSGFTLFFYTLLR